MLHEPVILVAGEVLDVRQIAGDEIVDRNHLMPFRKQAIRQVRTKKTGATGNDGNGLRSGCHVAGYLLVAASLCEEKQRRHYPRPKPSSGGKTTPSR